MVSDMVLEPMPSHQWPALYRLMVSRHFPGVPPRFEDAKPMFGTARIQALMDGHELAAAFVCGPEEDGIAFLDVVCAPRREGYWATSAVLRQLYALAFETYRLRAVWVQPHGRKAIKACLQAGFQWVDGTGVALNDAAPVLMMTRHGVPRRFRSGLDQINMHKEGQSCGQSV